MFRKLFRLMIPGGLILGATLVMSSSAFCENCSGSCKGHRDCGMSGKCYCADGTCKSSSM